MKIAVTMTIDSKVMEIARKKLGKGHISAFVEESLMALKFRK